MRERESERDCTVFSASRVNSGNMLLCRKNTPIVAAAVAAVTAAAAGVVLQVTICCYWINSKVAGLPSLAKGQSNFYFHLIAKVGVFFWLFVARSFFCKIFVPNILLRSKVCALFLYAAIFYFSDKKPNDFGLKRPKRCAPRGRKMSAIKHTDTHTQKQAHSYTLHMFSIWIGELLLTSLHLWRLHQEVKFQVWNINLFRGISSI